ncbi:hypothetical protein WJX72_000715 [[Myrmecia] bisecta]|uniref:RBR-type E3 ubiquitin transferase n=1 Tax=[Myrmecia] bisecta TaxID=41462 RepID=A0AAW1P6G4_9CHLO
MDSDDDGSYPYDSESMEYISDEDNDFGFPQAEEPVASRRKAPYAVFTEDQLRERIQEALDAVTSVLSISEAEAVRVLRHCRWDVNRVNEEWFSDTAALRDKVGLVEAEPSTSGQAGGKVTCGVCFDDFKRRDVRSARCGHLFCKDCWQGYVTTAIANGPSVLDLRCPTPKCAAAVPRDLIFEVASKGDQAKYLQYGVRSYVEDNRAMGWCPAPGCENAVECLVEVSSEPLDIHCNCGHAFCFTCKEEAHRPVDCATVEVWLRKNSAESENLNWILANTKQCPKCKRAIEKNQGCMHMTCSQCKFEFCWLCLGSWQEHGERTGGFYACNRFEAAKKRGEYDEETLKREHAKNALERYMHYYQRWAENDRARLLAINAMKAMTETTVEQLSEVTMTPTSQLKFVVDAMQQVVDCRRILKWTYCYGYYNFANDDGKQSEANKQQQNFFEYNQEIAEVYLDRLHGVTEKELNKYVDGTITDLGGWGKFRENLIGLTDVTRSHFDKLVEELEKGLDHLLTTYRATTEEEAPPEVAEEAAAGPSSSKAKPEASKAPSKKASGAKRGRQNGQKAPAASRATESNTDLEATAGHWQCRHCTFANQDLDAEVCEVCEMARWE